MLTAACGRDLSIGSCYACPLPATLGVYSCMLAAEAFLILTSPQVCAGDAAPRVRTKADDDPAARGAPSSAVAGSSLVSGNPAGAHGSREGVDLGHRAYSRCWREKGIVRPTTALVSMSITGSHRRHDSLVLVRAERSSQRCAEGAGLRVNAHTKSLFGWPGCASRSDTVRRVECQFLLHASHPLPRNNPMRSCHVQ